MCLARRLYLARFRDPLRFDCHVPGQCSDGVRAPASPTPLEKISNALFGGLIQASQSLFNLGQPGKATVQDVVNVGIAATTIYMGGPRMAGRSAVMAEASASAATTAVRAGTKGASGEFVAPSSKAYFGNSTNSAATGGTPRAPMQPEMQRALDAVKNPSRSHGDSCEIDAMNKALAAGDTLRGGRMGPVIHNESRRVLPACSTCREVKKTFGVE